MDGPSVVWDFSSLETQSTLISYMYSAYSAEKSMDIPEANTVLEEYGTQFYFKSYQGKIEQYGTVTKNNTLTIYEKPFVKMVFPFNFGDTYSGDFYGTVYGKNNYEAKFTGTFTLEADAYGTLILPGNMTYSNVFRIKTTKEQCYNGKKTCNCATISYKWYAQDIRYPLLTIIQNSSSTETKTIRTAYYSKAQNSSEDQKPQTFINENIEAKIYPNPFMNEFTLDYTIAIDSDVRIEIYDNTGRKVFANKYANQKAGYYSEIIKSDDIGDQLGIFHVRIISGEEFVSKTIIRGE
jgi:hypothetical protein